MEAFTKRYKSEEMSVNRYMQLCYMCLQHSDYQRKLVTAKESGNSEKASAIQRILDAIDTSASIACKKDDSIKPYIMENITTGAKYEMLNPPCGRRQFYAKRRVFFAELDRRV